MRAQEGWVNTSLLEEQKPFPPRSSSHDERSRPGARCVLAPALELASCPCSRGAGVPQLYLPGWGE